jgi:hypothetical protein
MGDIDVLEHMAALSELIDSWLRHWARRRRFRRSAPPGLKPNQDHPHKRSSWSRSGFGPPEGTQPNADSDSANPRA